MMRATALKDRKILRGIEFIAVIFFTCSKNAVGYVSNTASQSKLFRPVRYNRLDIDRVPLLRLRKRTPRGLSRFGTNPNNGVGREEDFRATNIAEDEYIVLQRENEKLKKQIKELEIENEDLQETCSCYQIVIEKFEGEGQTASNEWYTKSDKVDEISVQDEKLNGGVCPIEPSVTFLDALRDRAYWLVGLLAFQSCSGFILSRNEALLETHPVIIYFLTMLVGAGGNAGNQASVRGRLF